MMHTDFYESFFNWNPFIGATLIIDESCNVEPRGGSSTMTQEERQEWYKHPIFDDVEEIEGERIREANVFILPHL